LSSLKTDEYSLESTLILKNGENGLDNLFTAQHFPKLSGILYFCVMTSLVALKMAAKKESLTSEK
jgi:hypothetical protein